MGQGQSLPSIVPPPPPVVERLQMQLTLEKRYTNEMVAYESVVKCEDGSSRRGLYFPEWRTTFYMSSGRLICKHMINTELKSKKVLINNEDAVRFQAAYLVCKDLCEKLELAVPIFEKYVKEADKKL
jgi:hypothetical protein